MLRMFKNIRTKYSYSLILLKELVVTEFKLRYQNSVLGYLWSLLKPLFLFIILYFVFVYFLKIGAGIPHWPVSMLLGIVLWNFFSEITNGGLRSIVSRGGLIRNINFPKYIIIMSSAISSLINLCLNLVIVLLFLFIDGVSLSWQMLLLPVFILEIFIFGIGVAFILSSIYVKLRDTQYIWEIVMQGLFYASAVIFPLTRVSGSHPFIANLMLMNPVAQSIQDARRVFISNDLASLYDMSGSLLMASVPIVITIIVFVSGSLYFRNKSPYFAEIV